MSSSRSSPNLTVSTGDTDESAISISNPNYSRHGHGSPAPRGSTGDFLVREQDLPRNERVSQPTNYYISRDSHAQRVVDDIFSNLEDDEEARPYSKNLRLLSRGRMDPTSPLPRRSPSNRMRSEVNETPSSDASSDSAPKKLLRRPPPRAAPKP